MSEKHVAAGKLGGRPKKPLAEKRHRQFSISIPLPEYLALNDQAVFHDCSFAEIVRRAVRSYLQRSTEW